MGEFPDNLQIAKVVPIYKTDDASHFFNYRPISILPCLSKILEKVVYVVYVVTHIQPLFILQKKAVRIITCSPFCTHSQPLFDKLKVLTIFNIYKFQISCFVFSHLNKLLPNPLSSFLRLNLEYHNHNTRHRHDLHHKFLKYKFAIRSQAPHIWNTIPLSLRQSLRQFNYKRLLKSYFLSITT